MSFNHLEGEVPSGGVFRNVSAISVMGNKKRECHHAQMYHCQKRMGKGNIFQSELS